MLARLGLVVSDDQKKRRLLAPAPIQLARVRAAAELTVELARVPALCDSVLAHDDAVVATGAESRTTDDKMTMANAELRASASRRELVVAWPPAVRQEGDQWSVMPVVDALLAPPAALSELATRLRPVDESLAIAVRSLTTLTGAPLLARVAEVQALLERPPVKPRELSLFLPSEGAFVPVSGLSSPRAFASLLLALRDQPAFVLTQLSLTEVQHRANGDVTRRWRELIRRVLETNQQAVLRRTAEQAARQARTLVDQKLRTDFDLAVKHASVRRHLRETVSIQGPLVSGKAAKSDEHASWISPTTGVAVALPFVNDTGAQGFSEPWLVPYLGANIYFKRVDRVIDPDDLVGDTFRQRNSLMVGVLVTKPSLNGTPVSGVWSSGPVPVVGFGHRMTPFIRIDGGVALFEHARRLPTVTDKALSFACWIGASIDADLWALVKGKF